MSYRRRAAARYQPLPLAIFEAPFILPSRVLCRPSPHSPKHELTMPAWVSAFADPAHHIEFQRIEIRSSHRHAERRDLLAVPLTQFPPCFLFPDRRHGGSGNCRFRIARIRCPLESTLFQRQRGARHHIRPASRRSPLSQVTKDANHSCSRWFRHRSPARPITNRELPIPHKEQHAQ
jgi:hypothetical protein